MIKNMRIVIIIFLIFFITNFITSQEVDNWDGDYISSVVCCNLLEYYEINNQKAIQHYIKLMGIEVTEEKNDIYCKCIAFISELLKDDNYVYFELGGDILSLINNTSVEQRYVWLKKPNDINNPSINEIENYMLNALLIKNGYAVIKYESLNNKYIEIFSNIQTRAKKNRLGIWGN